MSAISRVLVALGLVSLFHAAYSAQEYSQMAMKLHVKPDLPIDIKIETLFAVFIACFGLVLGSESLKPVAWNVWAGKIEKEGGAANPFRALEERSNYVDIRAKREEFAKWAKGGGIAASR